MAELSLTNIVTVSVSAAQSGAGDYNTSNLAIFTQEPYDSGSFGSLGYKIYLSPTEVGEDFGTDSETYGMANSIFSQQPNILAGNGYLVVIPFVVEVQSGTASAAAASGTYRLNFGGDQTSDIAYDATASTTQTAVRTLTGLEDAVVTGTVNTGLSITFNGYYGNAALLTVSNNSMQTSGLASVTLTIAQVTAGETYAAAITRTNSLVQYFGVTATQIFDETDTIAAAEVLQPLNKIGFFVQRDPNTVGDGGILDLLTTGNLSHSRGLFYGEDNDSDCFGMMAAYAGRALSTNFSGNNTTSTMHLKDLIGVQPDPSMTQTLLNLCTAAGADVYASFQGVPKVFTSGANEFFDQVYNLQWFVGAIQIAGFNFLAQSSTKIPQTENGMDGLKGAYRNVCEQAVNNAYSAPGSWNSSTTFGNQQDFLDNIRQVGYYIYSQPVASQSQNERADRQAPLVQIALKEAGAIQKSNVIIYVNE